MKLLYLKYLLAIAKYKSISNAAKHIYISQPSLSEGIQKLEKELNYKLLVRKNDGVYLTYAGKKAVAAANQITTIIERLKQECAIAEKIIASERVSLDLYTTLPIGETFLSKLIPGFCLKYSNISLRVFDSNFEEILNSYRNNKQRFCLISLPDDSLSEYTSGKTKLFNFHRIFKGKLFAVVGKNHPLANRRTVSLREVIKYPLILNLKTGCFSYEEMLKKYGEIDVVVSTDIMTLKTTLLEHGLGVAIATSFLLIRENYPDVVYIPIDKVTKVSMGFTWLPEYHLSPQEQFLVNEAELLHQDCSSDPGSAYAINLEE